MYRFENPDKVSSKPATEYFSNSIEAIKKINGLISNRKSKRKMLSIIYKKSLGVLNDTNNLKTALEILKTGVEIDPFSYQLCRVHIYYRKIISTILNKENYLYKVRLPIISKDLFNTNNQFMKYPIEKNNLVKLLKRYENNK